MSKNNPIDELKQINNFLRFTSLSKEKKKTFPPTLAIGDPRDTSHDDSMIENGRTLKDRSLFVSRF